MSVIITPQNEIKEYFESDNISQSYLKNFLGDYVNMIKEKEKQDEEGLYYEEKENMIIGSAVDIMLTAGQDAFNDTYHVSDVELKPTATEMSLAKQVFDNVSYDDMPSTYIGDYMEELSDAIIEQQWYKGKPGETRTTTLINNVKEYFEDLCKSYGKQIISKNEYDIIQTVVFSLKTHHRTAKYFDNEENERNVNIDIYYQLPIYFEYRNCKCKALLDIVIVVLENGSPVTVAPIDLKTTMFTTIEFPKAIKMFRYDFQGAWYTLAVKSWIENNLSVAGNKTDMILPFRWIVESTSNPGSPLLYQATQELMNTGRIGIAEVRAENEDGVSVIVKYAVKGYEQCIDEHLWYTEHGFEQPKQIQKLQSEFLNVGWDGIIEDEN